MRYRATAFGICVFVTALVGACAPASAEPPKPDSGKFTLLLQGKTVGDDTFRLLPDGCDSDVHLSVGGQDLQFHQTLKFKKGQWSQVVTDAGPQGTMALTLAGDKSILKLGDKQAAVHKLGASVLPYGDRSPHLLAYLLSAYDSKKGGDQKFDLVFSEGLNPKGGLLVLTALLKEPVTSNKQIGGKSYAIARYPLTLNGTAGPIAMEVVTDKDKHVLFWAVPAQKYSAVRDGFQDLAK
jgi:hypothetical protein